MRAWVDGTFLKEGSKEETATPWHNDECLFPFSGEHSPSMWVALTDMGPDKRAFADPWPAPTRIRTAM